MSDGTPPSGQAPKSAYFLAHEDEEVERRTLAVIVDNEPGVLARVIGLFSGRGYNIESLTVAETDHKGHRPLGFQLEVEALRGAGPVAGGVVRVEGALESDLRCWKAISLAPLCWIGMHIISYPPNR